MRMNQLISIIVLIAPLGLSAQSLEGFTQISQENFDSGVEGRKTWQLEKESAEPGYLSIHSNGVAWIYKSPPYTGDGHGDGIAPLKFYGRVTDSSLKPIQGATISEKAIKPGGGGSKTLKTETEETGRFALESFVGASIALGEYAGDRYQTSFRTFIVSCEGYQDLEITVGFGCPEVLIQLTAKQNEASQE